MITSQLGLRRLCLAWGLGFAALASLHAEEPSAIYDVRTFGAVGDGKTLDTRALQDALDACARSLSVSVELPSTLSGVLPARPAFHREERGLFLACDSRHAHAWIPTWRSG